MDSQRSRHGVRDTCAPPGAYPPTTEHVGASAYPARESGSLAAGSTPPRRLPGSGTLAFHLALLALLVGMSGAAAQALGPLSRHMLLHIFTMGVMAPMAAILFMHFERRRQGGEAKSRLLTATVLQLVIFVLWHTPALMAAAMRDLSVMLAMQVTLFAVSVNFWMQGLRMNRRKPWLFAASLMVSGKIFCLLAAVMLFAPQPAFHVEHMGVAATSLYDQQTAGLIMLAVCPLIYVISGIVLIARWFLASCRLNASPLGGN